MTKLQIQAAAASFCKAQKVDEWSQDAHNAFVRTILRDHMKLGPDSLRMVKEAQEAMGSLTANASAFRQWLENDKVAILKPTAKAEKLADRYGV